MQKAEIAFFQALCRNQRYHWTLRATISESTSCEGSWDWTQLACHRDNSFVGTVVQLPFELITQVKYALFSVSIFTENPRIFLWHYKQFGVERIPLQGIQSSNKNVTWFLWKTFCICLQNTLDDRIKSTVLQKKTEKIKLLWHIHSLTTNIVSSHEAGLLSWLDKLCILNLSTDIWGTKKHIIAKKNIPLKQNHELLKLNVNDIRWHRKSISLYTCTLGIKKKSTIFLNLRNADCKTKIM